MMNADNIRRQGGNTADQLHIALQQAGNRKDAIAELEQRIEELESIVEQYAPQHLEEQDDKPV